MNREPPPSLTRHGQSMLEKKLLAYFVWRAQYRFEWRVQDMTNFDPALMPELLGGFEFVSFFEFGTRVFLFENKVDRQKAIHHYYNLTPTVKTRKTRRSKRVRKPRTRK